MKSTRTLVSFVPRGASAGAVIASLLGLAGCAHASKPASAAGHSPVLANPPAGITAPQAVHTVRPTYPEDMRNAGITGSVRLWCIIGADGAVRHVVADRESDPRFASAAIEAVKAWTFTPGTREGQPVALRVELPVDFTIEEGAERAPTVGTIAIAGR